MLLTDIIRLKSNDEYIIVTSNNLICLTVRDSDSTTIAGMNLTKNELAKLIAGLQEHYNAMGE